MPAARGLPRRGSEDHGGCRLPARYVIHAAGPAWRGGDSDEDGLLASRYRSCNRLAEEYGVKSIAFPSISTGAYRFPVERAAPLAAREVRAGLEATRVERAIVVCFNPETLRAYEGALRP